MTDNDFPTVFAVKDHIPGGVVLGDDLTRPFTVPPMMMVAYLEMVGAARLGGHVHAGQGGHHGRVVGVASFGGDGRAFDVVRVELDALPGGTVPVNRARRRTAALVAAGDGISRRGGGLPRRRTAAGSWPRTGCDCPNGFE